MKQLIFLTLFSINSTSIAQLAFEEEFSIAPSFTANTVQLSNNFFEDCYDIVEKSDGTFLSFTGGLFWNFNNELRRFCVITEHANDGTILLNQSQMPSSFVDPFSIKSFIPNTVVAGSPPSEDLMHRRIGYDPSDNSIVTYGLNNQNELVIRKRDQQGNIIFSNLITATNFPNPMQVDLFFPFVGDIQFLEGGEFIILVTSTYGTATGNIEYDPALLKFKADGTLINVRHYKKSADKFDNMIPNFIQKLEGDAGFFLSYSQISAAPDKSVGVLLRLDSDLNPIFELRSKYSFQYPIIPSGYDQNGNEQFIHSGILLANGPSSQIFKWIYDNTFGQHLATVANSKKINNYSVKSLRDFNGNLVIAGNLNPFSSAPQKMVTILDNSLTVLDGFELSAQNGYISNLKFLMDNSILTFGNSDVTSFNLPSSGGFATVDARLRPFITKINADFGTFCSDESPLNLIPGDNSIGYMNINIPIYDLVLEQEEYTFQYEGWGVIQDAICCSEPLAEPQTVEVCCDKGSFNYTWNINLFGVNMMNGTSWTTNALHNYENTNTLPTNNLSLNITEPGTYYFYFQNEEGCTRVASINISCFEKETYSLNFAPDNNFCWDFSSSSHSLPNLGGFNGTWSGSGVVGSAPSQTFDPWLNCQSPALLTYDYIDGNGCRYLDEFPLQFVDCRESTWENQNYCLSDVPLNPFTGFIGFIGTPGSFFFIDNATNNVYNTGGFVPPADGFYNMQICFTSNVGNCGPCFPFTFNYSSACKTSFETLAEDFSTDEIQSLRVFSVNGQLLEHDSKSFSSRESYINFKIQMKEKYNQILIMELMLLDDSRSYEKF